MTGAGRGHVTARRARGEPAARSREGEGRPREGRGRRAELRAEGGGGALYMRSGRR